MAVLLLRVAELGVARLRLRELGDVRRLIAELLAGVTRFAELMFAGVIRLGFPELLFAGIIRLGFAELLFARVTRLGLAELEVAGWLRVHRRLAGLRVAVERSAEGVGAAAAHPGLLVVVVERGREDRVLARPVRSLAVRVGGRGLE
ncbi:hypothetical protein [Acrocarpospora pleiomorpha]|uniref:hypothetical protein n=1 Tax=Acrocarpospora pleiomorpha TaxID=90975 RepID=UPI0012D2FE78|nr:hypothetical protein [Acrocarpospora pleiomorpha]